MAFFQIRKKKKEKIRDLQLCGMQCMLCNMGEDRKLNNGMMYEKTCSSNDMRLQGRHLTPKQRLGEQMVFYFLLPPVHNSRLDT
jgi:hypothetical protein